MLGLTELQKELAPGVLAGLADDNGDGAADAEVIAAIAAAAERDVRLRVAGTLSLPAGELPPALRDIALTFAVERLYERRHEVLPGDWTARAQRARLLLAEIADGLRPVEGATRRPAVSSNADPQARLARTDVLGNL
ncbi:MAG: Bacteriophage Mu, Gp36 [Candidatus Sumerlaeota bacterium]|nr:Bacteriophage Mu, Gp36 [Candidatus Sumerlaeota bacterium]